MPAPPTETELKLQLAAADVDRLRQSAALSQSACSEVDIDNVYYDTRDLLLRRHRMSLRVRRLAGGGFRRLKLTPKAAAPSPVAASGRLVRGL